MYAAFQIPGTARRVIQRFALAVIWGCMFVAASWSSFAQESPSAGSIVAAKPVPPPIHIIRLHKPGAAPIREFAVAGAHANYFGGPVISSVHVVQVLYGQGSYVPNVAGTATPTLGQFYTDITQSPLFDMLSEYSTVGITAVDGTPGTNQLIGHGLFDGTFTISPSPANNGTIITDAQVQSELLSQVAAGSLPAPVFDAQGNNSTVYMIFFPAGKTITDGTSSSCAQHGFCAYHNSTSGTFASHRLFYGVHPDVQPPSLCSQGCGAGTSFDIVTNVASHELSEAVTDPDVGPATTFTRPLAWIDPSNDEIGDICTAQENQVVMNGTSYMVQREFSDLQNDCVSSPPVFNLNGPSPVPPGQQFEFRFAVQNALGAGLGFYNGTVHFSSSDPAAVLPPDYSFTYPDQGSHNFIATLNTPGPQTILATDTRLPAFRGTFSATVGFPRVTHFFVLGPVTAGKGVPSSIYVAAYDDFGLLKAYDGKIHVVSSDPSASLPVDAPLSGGQGTVSVTFNTAGPQGVTISDSVNTSVTSFWPTNVVIPGTSPTATTLVANPNPSTSGQTVTYTATVSGGGSVPTGTVTFQGNGTFFPVTLDASGHAQLKFTVSSGTTPLYANYGGDAHHTASSSSPLVGGVNPGADTMSLAASQTSASFGTPVTISATLSSAALPGSFGGLGIVTFTDNGKPIEIADAAGRVSFTAPSLSVGSHTLAATFSGNADFLPASAGPVVVNITSGQAPDYSLSSNVTSATVLAGQSTNFFLTAKSLNGFSGDVHFTCGNLPPLTTCAFNPPSGFIGPSSPTLPVTLTVKTTGPHASLLLPATNGKSKILWWGLSPLATALLMLPDFRRKRRGAFLLIFIALLLLPGLTSCGGGGGTGNSTPAPPITVTPTGTSTMTVTAAGVATSGTSAANPTQQLNISITVQ